MEPWHQGNHLTLKVWVEGDRAQEGIHMHTKARLALKSMGIREFLASGTLVGCVYLMLILLTQTEHTMMGYTHKKACIRTSGTKRANILRLALIDDATS